MKPNVLLCAVAILCIIPFFYAHSQEEIYLVIDKSVFVNPQRPAAVFDHDVHNEKADLEDNCAICHHVYDGKTLVEGESSEDSYCSDCHSLEKTDDNSVPLRAAYHRLCKSCHVEVNNGPLLCGECHKRD